MILLALPVFLVAGWSLAGWALAAVLWVASEGLGFLLAHLRLGMGHLAMSGVAAVGMMFRAIVVMMVLIAIAGSNPELALSAALVYVAAYTLELAVSLASYFGQEPVR